MNRRARRATSVAALGLSALLAACPPSREAPPAASPPAPSPSSPPAAPEDDTPRPFAASPSRSKTGWLRTHGNRILLPSGKPFVGRGANLHDTRSCDACTFEPPRPEEVMRRADALVDEWHAGFIRLLLESYRDKGPGRLHYRSLLEDDDYLRDVVRIVDHIGDKPGVYVLVSLWQDESFDALGWPTARTRRTWQRLARALRDRPHVLFGLVNEPQKNFEGKLDAFAWKAMNDAVAAIREVELPDRRHVVTVQGTRDWGRSLAYYVDHPITAGGGENVAYETHVYNPAARFDDLVARPSKRLPIVIGEMGNREDADVTMSLADCRALWDLADRLEIPWLAWTFHGNCPPNLLVERKETCGAGMPLTPSPWGRAVKERLARSAPR